jgi:hypothetical protein
MKALGGRGVIPPTHSLPGQLRFEPRHRQEYFSSNLCVQTDSGAHPASCTMGTGGPFPGGKARQGMTLTTHPHPEQRSWMSRSYTSCAYIGVLWDCFTFAVLCVTRTFVIFTLLTARLHIFPPWRWGGSSTQAWMPTYVSILRIPQTIWVWRATVEWY